MQISFFFNKILKLIGVLWVLGAILSNAGCGAGAGKNKKDQDPLAEFIPVLTSVTYASNGSTVTLVPPFLTTQIIVADLGTGSCTGNTIEINFNGTYNQTNVSSLSMTGLTATNNSAAGILNFTTCMDPGSASVTITAFDAKKAAIRSPLTLSLMSMTFTRTLGLGHPRYPNTGLTMMNAAPNLTALTSGATSMTNVSMGSVGAKTTQSTGSTGYTMETGYANYVKQLSP